MGVVVRYDEDEKPVVQSIRGMRVEKEEMEKAYKLDSYLKEKLKILGEKLSKEGLLPKGGGKGKVESYWELGSTLRHALCDSGLVDPAERNLFWINARMHTPLELLADDRGPRRIHLEYCFRLSGYPKESVMRMNWSEWVNLFDRKSINREPRFDSWFDEKMKGEPEGITRKSVRVLSQFLNSMLGNVETADLSTDELQTCYEGAWRLTVRFLQTFTDTKESRNHIAKRVKNQRDQLGRLIEGKTEPWHYAETLIPDA